MTAMHRHAVRYALVLLLLVAAVALAYFLLPSRPYAEADSIAEGAQSFKELSDRFQKLADDKGAEYAFEILRRAQLPPNTDLHLLGHVVGDELYKQKGVDGIALCTQEFRNACSHSIVIGTLNEFGGEPALAMIRDACKKAPGGSGAYTMCYHGLGHGVFAFYGYDLTPTIDMCKKTGTAAYQDQEYIECAGGAVMELMGGGGHDPEKWVESRKKYLLANEPLSPCMDTVIPDRVKPLCLIYLTPRLWELVGIDLGRPDPSLFPKAFAFCDTISHSKPELRHACYAGFGKEFVPLAGSRDIRGMDNLSDDEYRTAISWCMSAGAEDGEAACVEEGVASIFWGGENDPEASFRYCALVEDKNARSSCFGRLAHDIGMYTSGSVRERLCARVPDEHQSLCLGDRTYE